MATICLQRCYGAKPLVARLLWSAPIPWPRNACRHGQVILVVTPLLSLNTILCQNGKELCSICHVGCTRVGCPPDGRYQRPRSAFHRGQVIGSVSSPPTCLIRHHPSLSSLLFPPALRPR